MSEFLREMKADLMSQNDKVTAEVSHVKERMDLLAESLENHKRCTNVRIVGI